MNRIDNDLIDPVVEPAGEKAHRVARVLAGALPVLGGAGVEIFNSIIEAPMSARRTQWMIEVGEALNALIDAKVLTEEGLQQNEAFVTTVAQASMLAVRNHQKEKIEALRNAVLNVAVGRGPEEDLRQIFLNFIDICTVTHIRLICLMNGPKAWARQHAIEYPSYWRMGGVTQVVEHALPELNGKEHIYKVIWADLYQRGFINMESLGVTMSLEGMLERRTTVLGMQLVRFLNEPNYEPEYE